VKIGLKEVARMLDLPEATILRWIRQGKIPVQVEGDRYVFMDKQLRSWARTHNIPLKENVEPAAPNNGTEVTLYEAMKRGGVFFDVGGGSMEEVLKQAVDLVNLPPEVDREYLLERLLQREELTSTGIGEGVAIPHPRYPMENLSVKAMVATCFLNNEVNFHSVDRKPVFVLFLMLSSTTKLHLKLLSRLSFCLRDKGFLKMLRTCRSADVLFAKVKELEASL